MDELVVKYYRRMCKDGFENTGEIKDPDIFLDTVGERIRICSHVSHAYLHIYISVHNGVIDNVKYLCTCDPMANVLVELLCNLLKDKTLAEAEALTVKSFVAALGGGGDEFKKKAAGVIELLHRGISRYRNGISAG
jgi:NifU-like protein involved in Fe-S cluster formation